MKFSAATIIAFAAIANAAALPAEIKGGVDGKGEDIANPSLEFNKVVPPSVASSFSGTKENNLLKATGEKTDPNAQRRDLEAEIAERDISEEAEYPEEADDSEIAARDISEDSEIAERDIEKRIAPIVIAVAGAAGSAGIAQLTTMAITAAADLIKSLRGWKESREAFTQKTTLDMWRRNPDYNRYPAVVCYNKGYHLKNPNGHAGRVKAKFSLGPLHTDYDCMYLARGNAFYTWSDGGYINLSYRHNSFCTFIKSNGDLHCK